MSQGPYKQKTAKLSNPLATDPPPPGRVPSGPESQGGWKGQVQVEGDHLFGAFQPEADSGRSENQIEMICKAPLGGFAADLLPGMMGAS